MLTIMKSFSLLIFVLLTTPIVEPADQASKEGGLPNYKNPIRTSDEDEIKNLPGLNEPVNFRQFSGYLTASDSKKPRKFLHYWFVESQSNATADPVLLWLNGGPGCSSMEGLLSELGPFQINDDGKTLKLNDFSWNKMANVLFLESPTGVGFSYSSSPFETHSDDSTARENHLAIRSFMKKFPQYKNNSLYLSGESYAGVYLPTLGERIDADPELNLKGIAIGNGYLDVSKLTDSLVFFAYHHGLVGRNTWKKISKHCCSGLSPSRESCTLSGKKASFACIFAVRDITLALDSGLNPYNLYGKCLGSHAFQNATRRQSRQRSIKERIYRTLRNQGFTTDILRSERPLHVFDLEDSELESQVPCVDDSAITNYLNDRSVRKAIHIPERVKDWEICASINYAMKYPILPGGLAPQIKHLIESKRNLTLLIYNGDVDTVCNFLGDEWFVDDLERQIVTDYSIWRVNKQVAGFYKRYDGITYVTIKGSGHMVPEDRPREALHMIMAFLNSSHGGLVL